MTEPADDNIDSRLRAYLADISEQATRVGLADFSARGGTARLHGNRPFSLAASALMLVAIVAIGTVTWATHRTTPSSPGSITQSRTALPPTPGIPVPRFAEAMAYDPTHKQTVMFGGEGAHDSLADTWTWDGHSWAQQHPAASPPPHEGASMAYDPALKVVLLVGGDSYTATAACPDPYRDFELKPFSQGGIARASSSPDPCIGPVARHDMWTWDGSTWRQLGALPMSSPIRGLAWDTSTQEMVAVAEDARLSTWALSGTSWTEITTTWSAGVSPDALEMATNPATGRPVALIFGAGPPCKGGASAPMPSPGNHGLDAPGLSSEGQTINCGIEGTPGSYGGGYIASTWTWTGASWQQLFSADMPFPPGPIASDAASQTLVLIVQSGTWIWSGSEWIHHTPSPTPPVPTPFGAAFGAMAEDTSGHIVYLAAGTNCPTPGQCTAGAMPGNTTWLWDGRAWSVATT